MAWKEVSYRLTGLTPGLIPHSNQTANPLNANARALKLITAKAKKTEADYIEMAHIEFTAALYMDKELGPHIPAENLEAMIQRAAMKVREGPAAKSGMFCLHKTALEYDGPRTPEELWNLEQFRFMRIVKSGGRTGGSVMRCRPIFESWACTATITIDDEIADPKRLAVWMDIAGCQIGLCDWRPRYGRFTAELLG
jgi:hypothetical protein